MDKIELSCCPVCEADIIFIEECYDNEEERKTAYSCHHCTNVGNVFTLYLVEYK